MSNNRICINGVGFEQSTLGRKEMQAAEKIFSTRLPSTEYVGTGTTVALWWGVLRKTSNCAFYCVLRIVIVANKIWSEQQMNLLGKNWPIQREWFPRLVIFVFLTLLSIVPRASAQLSVPPILVEVRTPTDGQTVRSDSTIHLTAIASEPRGIILQVDYYDGPNRIASSSRSGFPAVWQNPLPGDHYLVAVATDIRGRTGTSAQVHVIVLPANDNFSAATKLSGSNISIVGSTFGATLEPGETDWIGGGPSVWYSWTAPADGRVYLAMPNWPWGIYFGALSGGSLTNLTVLGHDLPFDGWETAYFYFEVQAGKTYHIVVAQFGGEDQPFTLNLKFLPKPPNDNFQHRAVLPRSGGSATVETFDATFQPGEPIDLPANVVGWTPSLQTVWWTWTAPAAGRVTIQPSGDFLYLMGIYQGLNLTNLSVVTQTINNGVTLDVAAGTTLQISVDGANGQSGFLNMNLDFIPSPGNDDFRNAAWVFGASAKIQGNNVAATSEPGEPQHAGVGGGHSVWWKWVAPASGYVVLSSVSNSPPPVIAIYTGQVVSNLNELASSATGTVSFEAARGTTYDIAVDGNYTWEGSFTLNLLLSTIDLTQPVAGSKYYVGDPIQMAATTTPLDGDGSTVNFFADDQFLGSAQRIPHPTFTWRNAELGPHNLTARITDRRGVTRSSEPVPIRVRPSNDDFAHAIVLKGLNVSTNGTNLGAGMEPGEPTGGDPSADASVWYTWTAPASGTVVVGIGENYFEGHPLGIYRGESVSNLVTIGESIYDFYPISFVAHTGDVYHIEVSGFSQDIPDGAGPFTLGITQTPAPANDDFANRIELSGSSVSASGSNIGATIEPGDPGTYATVWWSWTAPGTGSLYVTATGDTLGPDFTFFTGESISNLTWIGNVGPSWFYGTDASGEVHVEQGQTYQIMLDGVYTHQTGNVSFNFQFDPSPNNDDFTNSYALIGLVAVGTSSNTTATVENGEPPSNGRTVWWNWRAPVSGPVSLGTSGSSFSPMLAVYSGTAFTNLVLLDKALSDLQFTAIAGTVYQISADANNGGQIGQIQLTLAAGLPANDNFANRIPLVGTNVNLTASTVGATEEPMEPVHGGFAGTNSIWYTWTAPAVGTETITVTGDGFSPTWSVYTGTELTNLSNVADSYTWPWNVQASGSFPVQPNVTYQIAVDGIAGGVSAGIIYLNLSFVGLPSNDNFTNATVISGTSIHTYGNTSGATHEPGEPEHDGYPGGHSIWWSWTAPADGQITIDTAGSEVTTLTAVYTGSSLTNLTSVAGGNTSFAPISFPCDGGVTYHIALDHWYSDMYGAVNLNLLFSSVQLTAPTNEAVFHGPSQITLTATNTIWDGIFTQMDFLADGNLIGSSTNTPYSFVWTNPPLGDHGLQARVTDTDGVVRLSPVIPIHVRPLNDDFSDRIPITGNTAVFHADGVNASLEPGEPSAGPVNWESVWWTWTSPGYGTLSLCRPSSPYFNYVLMAVYSGSTLTNLTLVTNTPYGGTYASCLNFTTQPGVAYQIAVAGSFFDQPDVPVDFTFSPFAANSEIVTATGINPSPAIVNGTVNVTSSQFSFSFAGKAGFNYTISSSTNLALPFSGWSTILVTNLQTDSATIQDRLNNVGQCFYRISPGP